MRFSLFQTTLTSFLLALLIALATSCGGSGVDPMQPWEPFSDFISFFPGDLHWIPDLQPDRIQVQEDYWIRAADNMGLHAVLHRPVDSSPSRRYPGLLLVPGGLMPGASWHATWRKSNAWNFVDAGLIVLIYDARGRGWSGGEEDFDGPVQQDDLATVIEWLNARDDVLPGGIGVASSSWGITVAAGAVSRHPDLPARFLVDLEGAGDRFEMTQWDDPKWVEIMRGHSTSDDEFWKDREAIRFVGGIACPYFRLQSSCDHAFDRFYVDHAINMVNGAVNGESPYVRLNDMPPNRTYDLARAQDYHWFPVGDTDETFYYAVLGAFCTTTHL